jgi:hypothetical protein
MQYFFSTKKDTDSNYPIAYVKGGKHKNTQIYVVKEDARSELKESEVNLFYEYINDKGLRLASKSLENILDALQADSDEMLSKEERDLYNTFKSYAKLQNNLKVEDGNFIVLPTPFIKGRRDVVYVCAAAGSGKSYWISNYAKEYNKLYPRSPIYFISAKRLDDEECYDDVENIRQLSIDPEFLYEITDAGNSYEHFAHKNGSLVIFDDAEALSKEQQKLVDNIMESILQIGRSKNITCVISRHILNAGIKTKVIMNEINKLVIFPNGISHYNLEYCLKNYLGLDKLQIKKLYNLKSRYVMIHTHMPRYMIAEHDIVLI